MSVRREALTLVGLVLAVDAMFVAAYFLAGLPRTSPTVKLAFTLGWTAITLLVVLRGLTRIRRVRFRQPRAGR